MSVLHCVPDTGGERSPIFFGKEARLAGLAMACLASAMVCAFVSMLLGLLVLLGVGQAFGLLFWLKFVASGLGITILGSLALTHACNVLLSRKATEMEYAWCLKVHRELGLAAPERGLDRRTLGQYVDAFYASQARKKREAATLPSVCSKVRFISENSGAQSTASIGKEWERK
ncbi:MAG: hypothetical protein UMU75_03650 [Halomonas sp.]|nr:hypothetical protein [Halomonas sp.]